MTTQTKLPGTEHLEELTTDRFASAPQTLGFAPNMVVRSFLLRRREGNVLLNASEGALQSAEAIERLGGAGALWLGHGHETATGAAAIAARLKVPVVVHAADEEQAAKAVKIAETFDGPRKIGSDLEAIPIPGHTPGSTAYLWQGPVARSLFTADSLYVKAGALRGALLESSDREAYLESLSRLREIEFDLLVPWVAEKGTAPATAYEPARFRREIDAIVARIKDGADG